MEQDAKAPFAYRNWREELGGVISNLVFEYPLFTDAHVTGEVTAGIGPYQIINTVAMGSGRPPLILRIKKYLEFELPSMDRTQEHNYHGGSEADEVAALLSLCLGIRLKAGGASRAFGKNADPMGRPIGYAPYGDPIFVVGQTKQPRPILESVLGSHSLDDSHPLAQFTSLSPDEALALVRAARMYQEAIWIVEASPELTWILLTSAIETVASQWRSSTETPLEKMLISRPELESLLREYGGDKADELLSKVAEQMADYMGATKTFIDFIIHFLPPPPPERPPIFAQVMWEVPALKKLMRQIYGYRSRALHGGHPFPAPICVPPSPIGEQGQLEETPTGLAASMKGAVWVAKDLPMFLHIFEYIVRNTILSWWVEAAKT
jgi:hypothetical protein